MDNIENKEKIKLLRQIYDYESKGLKVHRHFTMSDDIEELQFHFLLLQNEEREFYIKQELQFYELLFKLGSQPGTPIPPKEELLKLCFGSKEYYEHHKQLKCNKNNHS